MDDDDQPTLRELVRMIAKDLLDGALEVHDAAKMLIVLTEPPPVIHFGHHD